jgi:hypothetical protein
VSDADLTGLEKGEGDGKGRMSVRVPNASNVRMKEPSDGHSVGGCDGPGLLGEL